MKNVIINPSGFILAQMEKNGWNNTDLAFVLGVTPASVSQLVNGKRSLTPETIKMLSSAFNISIHEISKIQSDWDLNNSKDADLSIAARAKLQNKLPIREMIKRGWIGSDVEKLDNSVCRFFGVNRLDDISNIAHSAKKTNYSEISETQLAWLYRARNIAQEMLVPSFNALSLENCIEKLSNIKETAENVRLVPKILRESGIRFIVVEHLLTSKIDGACFWLDDSKPVIAMSLRFDRLDNFWFVLAHELGHLKHGHGKDSAIIDSEILEDENIEQDEKIANLFASNFCIPNDKFNSFFMRKNPFFAERDVLAFAKIIKVHPCLVIGQLQKKLNRYDLLRKHFVKVRSQLTLSMPFDGWGDVYPTEN